MISMRYGRTINILIYSIHWAINKIRQTKSLVNITPVTLRASAQSQQIIIENE